MRTSADRPIPKIHEDDWDGMCFRCGYNIVQAGNPVYEKGSSITLIPIDCFKCGKKIMIYWDRADNQVRIK